MSALIELSGFKKNFKGHKVAGQGCLRGEFWENSAGSGGWLRYISIHTWNSHRINKIYLKIKCEKC